MNTIDWNGILTFVESNLLWELLVVLLVSIVPGLIEVYRNFCALLKDNRPTRHNARGKHWADRFLDIWKSGRLPFNNTESYKFGFVESVTWQYVIDEALQDKNLVQLLKEDGGRKTIVKAVRNWKTRLLALILKIYLISFAGDKSTDYK